MKVLKRLSAPRIDKLVLFILLSFTLLTWSGVKAEAVAPGYQRAEAPLISPLDAQRVLDVRAAEGIPLGVVPLSSTEATPEIQELARGLKNDPDLMYECITILNTRPFSGV